MVGHKDGERGGLMMSNIVSPDKDIEFALSMLVSYLRILSRGIR